MDLPILTVVRVSWLVLCGMMLFSRFVFQAAGPVWMRHFLDLWKDSRTHRAWGWATLLFGLAILAGLVPTRHGLSALDWAVSLSLVLMLCADGMLNLFPSWFGHFKERMQDSWVKRHRGTGREGDKHLFATVNFFLGAASVAAAAAVYAYRPLEVRWLVLSVLLASLLMTVLIRACLAEERRLPE